jgi:hypothetical protein
MEEAARPVGNNVREAAQAAASGKVWVFPTTNPSKHGRNHGDARTGRKARLASMVWRLH